MYAPTNTYREMDAKYAACSDCAYGVQPGERICTKGVGWRHVDCQVTVSLRAGSPAPMPMVAPAPETGLDISALEGAYRGRDRQRHAGVPPRRRARQGQVGRLAVREATGRSELRPRRQPEARRDLPRPVDRAPVEGGCRPAERHAPLRTHARPLWSLRTRTHGPREPTVRRRSGLPGSARMVSSDPGAYHRTVDRYESDDYRHDACAEPIGHPDAEPTATQKAEHERHSALGENHWQTCPLCDDEADS